MRALKAVLLFAFLKVLLGSNDSYLRTTRKKLERPTDKAVSASYAENPEILENGLSSSSSIESSVEEKEDRVVIPIIEACRRCNIEEAKRILEEDPNTVKVMNWKPLYGLAATAESQECLALLDYILSTIKFPQNIMVSGLSTASLYGRLEAFELLFDTMLELGYTIPSLSFSLLCDRVTPRMLEYILDSKTISKKLIGGAVQRVFQTGRVEILHMLMQHLDEDSVFDLVPGILASVRSQGCPEALETMFGNVHFQNAGLGHINYFIKLAKEMIKKSLKYPKFTEYSKTVDVLLRVTFVAEEICSPGYLHRAVTEGHVDLGLILRRRCPHTLATLNIKYFTDAMKGDRAADVFEAFADIFIMSGTDYMETFLAAIHRLDRSLIATIYEWAKSNDYLLGLDVRMSVVELAIKELSSPERLFDPLKYQQQQQFIQLTVTKTKELNELKERLDKDPSKKRIAKKIRDLNKVIADAYAMVMSLKIDPGIQESINYLKRRLLTLVYAESTSLANWKEMKEIAKNHDLSKLLKYLNNFSHLPGDHRYSDEGPEEFDWYQ